MRDPYSVLQVALRASDAEIKSAFRTLAKSCHPDVRPGDQGAEQTFHEARQAYRLLTNPQTRRMYDDYLENQRAAERARRRRAVRTMSASFLLTVAAVALAAVWWEGHVPVGRIFERAGAHEPARAAIKTEPGNAGASTQKPGK